ncbi:serine protease [Streptomyces sp. HPF1205]|uniref:trypsin-like peptidase domain-containing protein n=1 Tax=Streptomyces sp. HPF1205 TaxID=2873262 RepID=UPI001CECAAB4|nr:serine protease [Streptomyces sp. HPF1205]
MGHHHTEDPWRVRVDDADGTVCGAGVLLDDRHVLTCAHVVRDAGAEPGGRAPHLRITSVACRPEWTRTARVSPDSWVHEMGTQRGDVALLRLDDPADCGTRTTLRRAPVSGGRVSAYGFPYASRDIGMGAEAELGPAGGREGEWVLLNQVRPGGPWIEPGYSGAGVTLTEGEFKGRVIGIVVADFVDGGARAAWMLSAETIERYLPEIERVTDGSPGNDLGSGGGPPREGEGGDGGEDVLGDSLRLALTQELTRLLGGKWAGTVVVGTGGATGAGSSWLVRLVGTADPAARVGLSDAELTAQPRDTVLGLGAIDAAYDARGKGVEDLRSYLVGRFGLAGGTDTDVVNQMLRRRPPACLVVGGVDLAEDPDALVRRMLARLARGARSRGLRLVLGFEGRPPAGLSYEVALDPEQLPADAGKGGVTLDAAEAAVRDLAAEEEAAALLQAEYGLTFLTAPRAPTAVAPRLRLRLAVSRGTGQEHELAAIRSRADSALARATAFQEDLRQMITALEDLRKTLELQRVRAARHFGDEDAELGELYTAAARESQTPPIDLRAARRRIRRFSDAVNRRIEGEEGEADADV